MEGDREDDDEGFCTLSVGMIPVGGVMQLIITISATFVRHS